MTAVNGLRERVVQLAGIRTPLLEAGPSSAAEAVVFVHGNPGSGRDWQELLRSVGEFARAVALDMPGFGKADKPDDFNYTVAGYACHLGECLTYLGISRVHLVLHDFSGPWGLEWAVANRAAFATAVLINTGVWLDYQWHIYARLWRTPVLGELLMASVTRRGFHFVVRRTIPPRLPRRVVDRWFDDYDWGTRRAILRLYRATDDPSRLGYEHASDLRPLARPALVIWGARDRYLPLWLAERQRDAFPTARIVVLNQSGHFPFIDAPTAVQDAMVPFIREHLARSCAT
jgi:pimeloyl-ACP methyl ester carboxylesterase